MKINAHTHHYTGRPDVLDLVSIRYGDVPHPQALWYSAGLHPWFVTDDSAAAAALWLTEQAVLPQVLAIGEAGLDKATTADWRTQVNAFEQCIAVAQAIQKPIVVHCVRAFDAVLEMVQHAGLKAVVFHGFEKKSALAVQITKAGHYLSFGPGLHKLQVAESLRAIPPDRFLLETDIHPSTSIDTVYDLAAAALACSSAALEDMVWHNAVAVFGI